MDVFERKETPLWRDLRRNFQNATPTTLEEFMVELYQLGRSDSGGDDFVFTDEKQQTSVKIAETLVAFRNHLINNSFPSALADPLTREHHMALFTKDFIKLSGEVKND